jgi:hypothetical protein
VHDDFLDVAMLMHERRSMVLPRPRLDRTVMATVFHPLGELTRVAVERAVQRERTRAIGGAMRVTGQAVSMKYGSR